MPTSNFHDEDASSKYSISSPTDQYEAVDFVPHVQLYVSSSTDGVKKPAIELKAFAKTRNLKPGESQTVKMTVKIDDMDHGSFRL